MECFTMWYADKVSEEMKQANANSEATEAGLSQRSKVGKINLATSVMKPIHASWLIKVINDLEKHPEYVLNGFAKAGILDVSNIQ